jgi:hypothetical protein
MIQNDVELRVTCERIQYFVDLLRQLRVTSRPDEFQTVSGAYRAEVECMRREVLEYLARHASQVTAKAS